MILNCIIIDDSQHCIELLTDYFAESRVNVNLHLINTYTDPIEALAEMRSGNSIDIVFMDILMPLMNGIQLSRLLKDKIKHLIFTTCDSSYAVDAYDMDASNYLMKPVSQKKFNTAIDKIVELEKNRRHLISSQDYFFIKCNANETRKINISDIIAIQGASNYVKIHASNQSYITYGKMRDYEQRLSTSKNFIRINKSFIISIPSIKVIKGKTITLINELQIPIGETYKDAIQMHLSLFDIS